MLYEGVANLYGTTVVLVAAVLLRVHEPALAGAGALLITVLVAIGFFVRPVGFPRPTERLKGFSELLHNPKDTWLLGYIEMKNTPTIMGDHKEAIQNTEP